MESIAAVSHRGALGELRGAELLPELLKTGITTSTAIHAFGLHVGLVVGGSAVVILDRVSDTHVAATDSDLADVREAVKSTNPCRTSGCIMAASHATEIVQVMFLTAAHSPLRALVIHSTGTADVWEFTSPGSLTWRHLAAVSLLAAGDEGGVVVQAVQCVASGTIACLVRRDGRLLVCSRVIRFRNTKPPSISLLRVQTTPMPIPSSITHVTLIAPPPLPTTSSATTSAGALVASSHGDLIHVPLLGAQGVPTVIARHGVFVHTRSPQSSSHLAVEMPKFPCTIVHQTFREDLLLMDVEGGLWSVPRPRNKHDAFSPSSSLVSALLASPALGDHRIATPQLVCRIQPAPPFYPQPPSLYLHSPRVVAVLVPSSGFIAAHSLDSGSRLSRLAVPSHNPLTAILSLMPSPSETHEPSLLDTPKQGDGPTASLLCFAAPVPTLPKSPPRDTDTPSMLTWVGGTPYLCASILQLSGPALSQVLKDECSAGMSVERAIAITGRKGSLSLDRMWWQLAWLRSNDSTADPGQVRRLCSNLQRSLLTPALPIPFLSLPSHSPVVRSLITQASELPDSAQHITLENTRKTLQSVMSGSIQQPQHSNPLATPKLSKLSSLVVSLPSHADQPPTPHDAFTQSNLTALFDLLSSGETVRKAIPSEREIQSLVATPQWDVMCSSLAYHSPDLLPRFAVAFSQAAPLLSSRIMARAIGAIASGPPSPTQVIAHAELLDHAGQTANALSLLCKHGVLQEGMSLLQASKCGSTAVVASCWLDLLASAVEVAHEDRQDSSVSFVRQILSALPRGVAPRDIAQCFVVEGKSPHANGNSLFCEETALSRILREYLA